MNIENGSLRSHNMKRNNRQTQCIYTSYSNVTRNIWSIAGVELLDVLLVLWSLTWIWPLAEVLAHGVASFALNLATILIFTIPTSGAAQSKAIQNGRHKKPTQFTFHLVKIDCNTHIHFKSITLHYEWTFYLCTKCMHRSLTNTHNTCKILNWIYHWLKLTYILKIFKNASNNLNGKSNMIRRSLLVDTRRKGNVNVS